MKLSILNTVISFVTFTSYSANSLQTTATKLNLSNQLTEKQFALIPQQTYNINSLF